MRHGLEGKVILVTGVTSGFGKSIAEKCLEQGASVVGVGRREEKLKLLKRNKNFLAIKLDVRNKKKIFSVVDKLPTNFKNIDVLVNNAGLALGMEGADKASLKDWEDMVDTNIKGLMYFTKAVLPAMIKNNNGHIVNIGSVAGNYPYPGGNAYGGTKAFVKQFSLNLRADLLGKRIRVTNIEPGMAETEFSIVRYKGDKKKAGLVYEGVTPLSAEDIADTVLWCITRPWHVNINNIELMPICQAFSQFSVDRKNGL